MTGSQLTIEILKLVISLIITEKKLFQHKKINGQYKTINIDKTRKFGRSQETTI